MPPAWWQTTWFRLACVAIAGALIWALFRLRIRQISALIGARFDERLLERTRIARDLHDTVLQTVQASRLAAENSLHDQTPGALKSTMQQLVRSLSEASDEARQAVQALRGSPQRAISLVDEFRELVMPLADLFATRIVVSSEGPPCEISASRCSELLKLGREAVLNALVHSKGTSVDITLHYVDDGLTLLIRDDGIGLDPKLLVAGRSGHFGIQGMRERARELGATLDIGPREGGGTEVRVRIPR
ncbi:hypothetical protein BH09PSE6_BH09PSE6_03680 [soil metagenome]